MSKITCPVCGNIDAQAKTTKQKVGALRRMPPKAYLSCPTCGDLFSNKVAFSNHIKKILEAAQEKAAMSDKQAENSNTMPENLPPPQQKPSFFGWSNRA